MKRQKNIRLSEASLEKLADLSQRYGTETTTIEIAIDRMHREETMNTNDLIRNLEKEYYGIQAANPDWEMTLWDFLISRKVEPDDIWEYSPGIGRDADQPEPDWL